MSATKAHNVGEPATEDVAQSMRDAWARSMTIPRKLFDAQMAAGLEIFKFAGRRMQAQAEMIALMGQCGNIEDAAMAQRAFLDKANEHYSAEFTHLMDMARNTLGLMDETVNAAQPVAKKAA